MSEQKDIVTRLRTRLAQMGGPRGEPVLDRSRFANRRARAQYLKASTYADAIAEIERLRAIIAEDERLAAIRDADLFPEGEVANVITNITPNPSPFLLMAAGLTGITETETGREQHEQQAEDLWRCLAP